MQGDDFRSLFQRSNRRFDLQAQHLEIRDPLAGIFLLNCFAAARSQFARALIQDVRSHVG